MNGLAQEFMNEEEEKAKEDIVSKAAAAAESGQDSRYVGITRGPWSRQRGGKGRLVEGRSG